MTRKAIVMGASSGIGMEVAKLLAERGWQVGIAGSTKVGDHVIMAGQTGVNGHITICDNAVFGGKTGIIGTIKTPGTYLGYPARTHAQWGRVEAALSHLPELMKKIRRLEKQLAEKEEK